SFSTSVVGRRHHLHPIPAPSVTPRKTLLDSGRHVRHRYRTQTPLLLTATAVVVTAAGIVAGHGEIRRGPRTVALRIRRTEDPHHRRADGRRNVQRTGIT